MNEKYDISKCQLCNGTGWMIQNTPPKCACGMLRCYLCENIKFRGGYTECDSCLGAGRYWINKETKKPTLIWCQPYNK